MILRTALAQVRGSHEFDLHTENTQPVKVPSWQLPSTCRRPPAKSFWQKLLGR